MKFFFVLLTLMIIVPLTYCQDDGGMLCGGEDIRPIWILRFNIIDRETHYPVKFANVEIFKNRGDGMKWRANCDGVAVLVISNPYCLPDEGSTEITSANYKYYTLSIKRDYFNSEENNQRILLEGHNHNWSIMKDLPSTQEIINKISAKKYRIGIKTINAGSYGCDVVNYAPACFEYDIELERIDESHSFHSNDDYSPNKYQGSINNNSNIPIINYNGSSIYVFPNDLSESGYYWEKAKDDCNNLNRLGYDDWYLPSKDELNILYQNKEIIGGFTEGWYWSSTEASSGYIWGQDFSSGLQNIENKSTIYNIHTGNIKVRCIRKD